MRYAEQNLATHLKEDFMARQRVPTLLQFLILFSVNYMVILGAHTISTSFAQFAFVTLLLLAAMNGIMVWSVQRSRDLMLITEFQNSLFSAALGVSSLFCLIVRKDGTVVYADHGFRTLFPQFEKQVQRTLADVLDLARASREESDKVYAALMSYVPEQLVVTLQNSEGKPLKTVLSVDPMRRPNDYLLLRGRPFVEQRSA